MTVEDCYQLGYVIKPHGLKGEVQAFLDVDSPEAYEALESVFVRRAQQLIPFFIESITINGDRAIIAFEEITTLDQAKALKGSPLFLPLSSLPVLEDDSFYYHEILGFRLRDTRHEEVGIIKNVFDSGPQPLLIVEHPSGREVLVPMPDELLQVVDRVEKVIEMEVPEGLLALYLNDNP